MKPVVECFDDFQGTSFCCIGTKDGNDGGVRWGREIERVVGVVGKEFARTLDLL